MAKVFEKEKVGTLVYANGDKYDGDWSEDKKEGEGTSKLTQ